MVVGSCLEQDKHLPSGIGLKVVHEVKQLQTGFGQVINTSHKSLVLINLVFSLVDDFSIMEVEVKPFLGITFTVSTALLGISFWPSGFVIGWVTVGRPSFRAPQQSPRTREMPLESQVQPCPLTESQSCASVSCASSTRSMCSWLFSPSPGRSVFWRRLLTLRTLGAWTSTGCSCRLAATSTTIWTRFMALANKKTFQQGEWRSQGSGHVLVVVFVLFYCRGAALPCWKSPNGD